MTDRLALLISSLAACTGAGRPSPGGGADAAPSGPTTLAELGAPGRLAITGDCIVVAQLTALGCVPLGGGTPHVIAQSANRAFVRAIADGDALIATSLPLDFGPGDAAMEVDRVTPDGAITAIAMTGAGYGAGEGVALAGDRVVFTDGGSADLLAVAHTGGQVAVLAFDSGNFGDLAIAAGDAYFVNGFSIYKHDLAGPESYPGDDKAVAGVGADTPRLASDGTSVVAAGNLLDGSGTGVAIVVPAGAPAVAKLPSGNDALAVAGGHAFIAAGGEVLDLDLASGTTSTFAAGEDAVDIIATPAALYWITRTGALRMLAR
jgi:hypothetical protein